MIIGSTQWDVLIEVAQERQHQDEKWGGPEHDDGHSIEEWKNFINRELRAYTFGDKNHRDRMVRVAALAVAAIESYDRLEKK